jgi:hypothetical protein
LEKVTLLSLCIHRSGAVRLVPPFAGSQQAPVGIDMPALLVTMKNTV